MTPTKTELRSNINSLLDEINPKIVPPSKGMLSFQDYLGLCVEQPQKTLRDILLFFVDAIKYYVPEGHDEYPHDEHSVGFVNYDFSKLFVEDCDTKFFADRLFANKFMNFISRLKERGQIDKIMIFQGPSGTGKSRMIENLAAKIENYASLEVGAMYEIVWQLKFEGTHKKSESGLTSIHLPCLNHENPILFIPREERKKFLDELIKDKTFKEHLFNDSCYQWVFTDKLCTICESVVNALFKSEICKTPKDIYDLIYVRRREFNRGQGIGISIFNPSDKINNGIITNPQKQEFLNVLFNDSNLVRYICTSMAASNNGVPMVQDIKGENVTRLIHLHGIISDKVHKIGDSHIDERIRSLFFAATNPEDMLDERITKLKSLNSRVDYIGVNYVLDPYVEVEIYKSVNNESIGNLFLPGVLLAFTKVIVSTRLNDQPKIIKEWIKHPKNYSNFTDEKLFLLKMELYRGMMPEWISEEDRKKFTPDIRNRIIHESECEGLEGISGRDSIIMFGDFMRKFGRRKKIKKLITMENVRSFFIGMKNLNVSEKFIESLIHHYDSHVLKQIKKSLYNANEENMARDIMNYLYCLPFEDTGSKIMCPYTGEIIEVTKDYFANMELIILGKGNSAYLKDMRIDNFKTYRTETLQKINIEGQNIAETPQFKRLFGLYKHNLEDDVLAPFFNNDQFRNAIKDYGSIQFNTYDDKIKRDIGFMMDNLQKNFSYTEAGAKEVCVYVLDKCLVKQ